jgi:CBS domain-containing protein
MLRLHDIMTRDVLTLDPEATIRDALEWFSAHHVSGAPVVSGGRVVGVVSLTDLATFVADLPAVPTERESQVESTDIGLDRNTDEHVLEEHTVADAMTRAPIHELGPETTVAAAADFLRSHDIHRVLVTERATLLGIVTTTDIAQAVAQHKLAERTYVFGHAIDAGFDPRGFDRRS